MKKGYIIVIVLVLLFVAAAAIFGQDPNTITAQNEEVKPTATSTPMPTVVKKNYTSVEDVTKGLDTFLTLQKIDDTTLQGINSDTKTRVRVVTDTANSDKVVSIYVWAAVSNDEATTRESMSILKTIAANTAPESISWLEDAYTTVTKNPEQTEEKTFSNKTITVGYADVTSQLTFREEIN